MLITDDDDDVAVAVAVVAMLNCEAFDAVGVVVVVPIADDVVEFGNDVAEVDDDDNNEVDEEESNNVGFEQGTVPHNSSPMTLINERSIVALDRFWCFLLLFLLAPNFDREH